MGTAIPEKKPLLVDMRETLQRRRSIRYGNPSVNLDHNFINMTNPHILDSSGHNATALTPINTEQTYRGDWLLKTPIQDEGCATFPSPYNNDYRGADPTNPNNIPSRFQPDKPVFCQAHQWRVRNI